MNALAERDEQIIRTIVAEQLQIDPAELTPEATFEGDLGADSLDVVQISMNIEDQLGLTIPDQAMEKVRTVGELFEAVANLKGNFRF